MTLKEKLEQYIDPQIDVVHLEKIADDYAIEFARFYYRNYAYEGYSTRELLEKFKKEKGL